VMCGNDRIDGMTHCPITTSTMTKYVEAELPQGD
jgi:hypothetical protein